MIFYNQNISDKINTFIECVQDNKYIYNEKKQHHPMTCTSRTLHFYILKNNSRIIVVCFLPMDFGPLPSKNKIKPLDFVLSVYFS